MTYAENVNKRAAIRHKIRLELDEMAKLESGAFCVDANVKVQFSISVIDAALGEIFELAVESIREHKRKEGR